MISTNGLLARSHVEIDDFQELEVDGRSHGRVHWVRDDSVNGKEYKVAIWEMPQEHLPYESPYVFRNDETIIALDGELEITWEDGTSTTIVRGDVVSIARGTRTTWRITKGFKKLVVDVEQ